MRLDAHRLECEGLNGIEASLCKVSKSERAEKKGAGKFISAEIQEGASADYGHGERAVHHPAAAAAPPRFSGRSSGEVASKGRVAGVKRITTEALVVVLRRRGDYQRSEFCAAHSRLCDEERKAALSNRASKRKRRASYRQPRHTAAPASLVVSSPYSPSHTSQKAALHTLQDRAQLPHTLLRHLQRLCHPVVLHCTDDAAAQR